METNTNQLPILPIGVQTENLVYCDYPVGRNLVTAKEFAKETAKAFSTISPYHGRNINIFCRGSSGVILATYFSMFVENNCKICHVKKPGEYAHNDELEYDMDAINIIIDDFISSGETIRQIYKRMVEAGIDTVNCLIVRNTPNEIKRINVLGFVPTYWVYTSRISTSCYQFNKTKI